MRENFSAGGNLKMIQSELEEVSKATTFACDVGCIWENKIRIGVVIANIESKIKYEQEDDSLSLIIKVGIAYRLNNLLLASEISKPKDDELHLNIGAEYWITQVVALRTGYKFKQQRSSLTAGAGFKISNYQLDYAYVPYDVGNTHHISALVRF